MNDSIKTAIIKTLAYFDIFSHPLNSGELFHLLYHPNGVVDEKRFKAELEKMTVENKIESLFSYYYLPGKVANVAIRERRVEYFEKKLVIAKKAVKKLRYVPFIKAVFICNTLSNATATDESDIDVFIVCAKNRIWLARLFATFIMSIFGLRRTKKKVKNKICLSFYINENALNLKNVMIEEPDIYLMYWLDSLIPIYDPQNYLKKIFLENKQIKKILPNVFNDFELSPNRQVIDSKFFKHIKKIIEKMWQGNYGNIIEKQAKEVQKAKMKINFLNQGREDGKRVVIGDEMLKFHENDRREEYKNVWINKIKKYGF